MGIITHLGELTLATRLHRLADLLQKDVTDIYTELGLDFQARWFPVLAARVYHHISVSTKPGEDQRAPAYGRLLQAVGQATFQPNILPQNSGSDFTPDTAGQNGF